MRGGALTILATAIALSALAASAVAPSWREEALRRAAQKAAAEVSALVEAAKLRRAEKGSWPASVEELKNEGRLPEWFPTTSPWGSPYRLSVEGDEIVVSFPCPEEVSGELGRLLPNFSWTNATASTRSTPPGKEPFYGRYLHAQGEQEVRTMEGNLLLGGHRMREVGEAVAPSDLVNLGQCERDLVNVEGDAVTGDVSGETFVSPRFVDQDDAGYFHDPSGSSYLNYENVQDVFIRKLGEWASEVQVETPKDWECVTAYGSRWTCCPPGYVPVSVTGGNLSITVQGQCWPRRGCSFYFSGSSVCISCTDWKGISLFCCR